MMNYVAKLQLPPRHKQRRTLFHRGDEFQLSLLHAANPLHTTARHCPRDGDAPRQSSQKGSSVNLSFPIGDNGSAVTEAFPTANGSGVK
jgi:hypothetical protein